MPIVASLTPTSPSHAVSVPISSAKGSPDEKPNASIVADLRVARAALRSFQPFGRWPAILPLRWRNETLDRFHLLPSPGVNGSGRLVRLVDGDEQFDAFGRFDLFTLQVAIDGFDRLAQLALAIGLHQAADRDLGSAGVRMTGGKQRRHALRFRGPGELDSGLVLAQPHVAEDQVDRLPPKHIHRVVEAIDRRDHLVTGVAEHIFIVERGQRLVLDDEDALDDLLTLPEQHCGTPINDTASETNEQAPSAAPAKRRPHCACRATAKFGRTAAYR